MRYALMLSSVLMAFALGGGCDSSDRIGGAGATGGAPAAGSGGFKGTGGSTGGATGAAGTTGTAARGGGCANFGTCSAAGMTCVNVAGETCTCMVVNGAYVYFCQAASAGADGGAATCVPGGACSSVSRCSNAGMICRCSLATRLYTCVANGVISDGGICAQGDACTGIGATCTNAAGTICTCHTSGVFDCAGGGGAGGTAPGQGGAADGAQGG